MGKKQAAAPKTMPFGKEAFENTGGTAVRWLGNGGLLLNSRGTCIMADPLLEGFDMPSLIDMPIGPADVPHLEAVLVTHSDGDHFSRETCRDLRAVCGAYYSTPYVAGLMEAEGICCAGLRAGEVFEVGKVKITVTPADHTWQNGGEFGRFERVFLPEDCCGFYMETPDGSLWAPGDSRLMEEHLKMPPPDAILFDFSDDPWHIGLENALKLAANCPRSILILSHWGSVDAPDLSPFNADPADLWGRIVNPDRARPVAAGELVII